MGKPKKSLNDSNSEFSDAFQSDETPENIPSWALALIKSNAELTRDNQKLMTKFFEATSQSAEREKRAEERERKKLEMLELEHSNKLKELELKIAEKLGSSSPSAEAKPQVQLKPPPELIGEPTFAEFKRWELKWKDYSLMVRLQELPLARQLGIFRSCLSPEMHEELVYGMGIPDDTSMTVNEILVKIRQFIRDKKNISLDRFEFHSCKQQEGETF